MHVFFRRLIWFAVVLIVPILPFMLMGERFETHVQDWLLSRRSDLEIATAVFGLLTADLFLPVPSTAVFTYAGGVLPWSIAFLAAFGGLSCGHLTGFGLARILGRPFAIRWGNEADLDRLDRLSRRYGPGFLIATRALPVLSEACVLFLGVSGMKWLPAIIAILLSNAAIAAVYVSLGSWFRDSPALQWAVIASALLPLLPLWWVISRPRVDAESGSLN